MRKSILYPCAAMVLGVIAAGLRMWQRAGYDITGLPVPFAPASVVLTVFLVLCGGAFLAVALRQPKALDDQPSALPHCSKAAMLLSAAGALVLVGGVVNLKTVADGYFPVAGGLYITPEEHKEAIRMLMGAIFLPGVMALASVPTAIALFHRAKLAKAGEQKANTFSVMMPSIFCWLWLIEVYRQHTSNPIVWDYVLLLLAVVLLLISAYERAGFAFGAGKPRRTMFTTPLALLLAVSALPDSGGLANAATLLALALHAAAELVPLMDALEYSPKRLAPDVPNQTTQEEEISHEQ